MATLAEQISQLAGAALAAHGLTLVQARLSGGTASGRGKLTLDVMAEMPDGTSPTLDLCIAASRTLSAQLDVSDIIKNPYTLEVGSSGLERPLMTPADYTRFNGKQAKLTFTRPIPMPGLKEGKKAVIGSAIGQIITPTAEGLTFILKDTGAEMAITYAQIHHAHLLPSAEELAELMKQANARTKELNNDVNEESTTEEESQ